MESCGRLLEESSRFNCLKVERCVSSRFEVSFGDFQQFFTAGPKSSSCSRNLAPKVIFRVGKTTLLTFYSPLYTAVAILDLVLVRDCPL